MSKHNRTSRRRRIALGLGATGSGLLAAAFMPMGIALADNVSDAAAAAATAATTGNFPTDNELVPDPASDFTGIADSANPYVAAADQQFNIDNPIIAAQFDYAIDNNQPFTFDGVSATVPSTFNPETGDLDPFEDAQTAFGITNTNAEQYDYALNQLVNDHLLTTTQVQQLDLIADGGTTTVTGTATEPTTPDPFLDALQATNTAATPTQIAEVNFADYQLDTLNPTYAAQLDTAVEAAVKAGTLSATSTNPVTGDANAFADAFTNAGATTALNPGTGYDTSDLSTLANQLDPVVDTLGNPAAAPDLDPAADFVQIFDPNAFAINPATGLEVPNDFVGQLAVFDDTFLQAIGLAAPLDQFVDLFTGSATTTGTDAMTGILGLFGL
jgi:hypothetical protein